MVDWGLAIGVAATKWVVKLWSKDDPTVELFADLGEVLYRSLDNAKVRRRAGLQLAEVAELVAERLEPLLSSEIPGIEDNEREAALLAADRALSGALSLQTIFDSNLDSGTLAASIKREDHAKHSSDQLSAAAEGVYDSIISEAAAYALQVATKMPSFALESTKVMFAQSNAIAGLAEKILREMPESRVPASWGYGSEFQRFESRYMRGIFEQANRLQLYGVTSSAARSVYPLSIAYIPLQVSRMDAGTKQQAASTGHSDEEESVGIEEALLNSRRLLLSGDAGSGKTTLLQWLTITASKAEFRAGVGKLNGAVPFMIQLRRFNEGDFPAPEGFVRASTPSLAGAMPDGWVHAILDDGRALVLVDGFDEVPDDRRQEALDWLGELERSFPENTFVVTSRDVAVEKSWTKAEAYSRVKLLPMQNAEAREFINHWHAAAAALEAREEIRQDIEIAKRGLLAAIRDRAALRSLCTSPLLCALICAMNLEGGSQLPSNRIELYDTALTMLVNRRDRDRRVGQNGVVELLYSESLLILEAYAYWLQDNRVADSTFGEFRSVVGLVLPRLHRVSASEEEVAYWLLERSGVLREPVVGRVDFIHRTFLEYLAARSAVAAAMIPKLIAAAVDDYWREVVILAAGHAAPAVRERLIWGLIERGEREELHRHVLYLIAVATLETSTELEPGLRSKLRECLAEVLPPSSMGEAAAVAAAGDTAVGLLQAVPAYAVQAAASVRALCLIGSDSALSALRSYATDRRVTVARQIIRGWSSFDAERYVSEVLRHSPLDRGAIRVTDPDAARFVHLLTNAQYIWLDLSGRARDLSGMSPSTSVKRISADRVSGVKDLSWASGFDGLNRLQLMDSGLESLSGAESLTALRWLDIDGTSVKSLEPLSANASLEHVDIANTPVASLAGLPADVKSIRVVRCVDLEDWDGIEAIAELMLDGQAFGKAAPRLASSTSLRSLVVMSSGGSVWAGELPKKLRSLRIVANSGIQGVFSGGDGLQSIEILNASLSLDLCNWLTSLEELDELSLGFGESMEIHLLVRLLEGLTKPRIVSISAVSSETEESNLPEVSGYSRYFRRGFLRYSRNRSSTGMVTS